MEMGGELLSWIIGIGLVVALLGGSSRKRRRRRHHSRGRKSSVRRFDRQRDVTDRRGGSGRFPRAALPGRVVRIIDGDGLVAEVPGFGRLNVRLAYLDAPEHDQPWGQNSKEALTRLTRGSPIQLRLLYRDRYARAVAVVLGGAWCSTKSWCATVTHGCTRDICRRRSGAVTAPWSTLRGSPGLVCGAPPRSRFRPGSGVGGRPPDGLPGWFSTSGASSGQISEVPIVAVRVQP